MMNDDVLITFENVSKKFCRNLKRSMIYGVQDIAGEMLGYYGRNAQLRKDEFWALNDINFELKRGECLGLIGRNGAGKSTILKLINGLIKPDAGKVTVRGRVGALIELGAGFNPILTGRENIYINGAVLGFSKKEIDKKFDAIVDFAEIDEFIDTPVQNYSSGMKVRLGFAIAAQMEPDVLLIDEVLAVGDAEFQIKCLRKIDELIKKHVSIILISHNMINIERVCTQGLALSRGAILYSGSLLDTIRHYLETKKTFDNTLSIEEGPHSNNPVIFKKGSAHIQESNLLIDITFQSDIEVNNASLVAILRKEGVRICNISSAIKASIRPGIYHACFHVYNLNLSYGHYQISTSLRDSTTPRIMYGINANAIELFVDHHVTSDMPGVDFTEFSLLNINQQDLRFDINIVNNAGNGCCNFEKH